MKGLFKLILIGVLIALGGAFFELWRIPRLEKFPTISRFSNGEKPTWENTAKKWISQNPDKAPPGGPLAPKEEESARAKQLRKARDELSR